MKFNEKKDKDDNQDDLKPNQIIEIEGVSISLVDDSPSFPIKTLIFTLILFLIGTVLLIAGLISVEFLYFVLDCLEYPQLQKNS